MTALSFIPYHFVAFTQALHGASCVLATDGDANVVDIAMANAASNASELCRVRRTLGAPASADAANSVASWMKFETVKWGNAAHIAAVVRHINGALAGVEDDAAPVDVAAPPLGGSQPNVVVFCIDVIYHRPAYPVLFSTMLSLVSASCAATGRAPICVKPAVAAQTWSWSGTESETEEEEEEEEEEGGDDDETAGVRGVFACRWMH